MNKKIIIHSLSILFFIFLVPFALAHPGNTDAYGCHTCRTNCASWGLSYGEYHCHNSKGRTQPTSPINSHWGSNGTGYTTPSNQYYSPPVIYSPSCPSNSTYSSIKGSCQCNYGHVSNDKGTGCITEDKWCENKYGWNSRFNSLDKACECSYGYVLGKDILGDIACVSGASYCRDLLGLNSRYNSISEKCECNYNYTYNGNACIKNTSNILNNSFSALPSSSCGQNSHATSDDKCICNVGYIWEDASNAKNLDCKKKTCGVGFILVDSECISHTDNCKRVYGDNVSGSEGDKDNSSCICETGYRWSENKDRCIKIIESLSTGELSNFNKSGDFLKNEKEKITKIDNNLTARLKGRILLQVEDNGEAWYLSPHNNKRYYMPNGEAAYNLMRSLGVGISNKDLKRIEEDKNFAKKNKGKIFLQVEDVGQAYYLDVDGSSHYLKDGEAAYTLMRNLGLGIRNSDLRKINIESE